MKVVGKKKYFYPEDVFLIFSKRELNPALVSPPLLFSFSFSTIKFLPNSDVLENL